MEVIIIKVVLAVIFTLSVVAKFTGKTRSTFENSGYNANIMYVIAAAEILLTAALFTRFELFAVAGLLAIMCGALFTLYRQKVGPAKFTPAVIATGLLIALLVLQISRSSSLT